MSQVHQSFLVEHVAPSSHAYQEASRQVAAYSMTQGRPAVRAQAQAIGWLGQLIGRQATLLAYIDVFSLAAVFTAVMVPFVLLLLLRPVDVGAVPAGH